MTVMKGERERGDDMQQWATGWIQIPGRCGKDLVHWVPALPGELPGRPKVAIFKILRHVVTTNETDRLRDDRSRGFPSIS